MFVRKRIPNLIREILRNFFSPFEPAYRVAFVFVFDFYAFGLFCLFFFPVFFTFIFESLRFDLPDFTWLCVCFSFFLMRPLSVRRPWHSARTEIQGGSCFFFVLFLYCFFTPRKPVFTSFFKTNFRFPYSFSGFSVSVFLFHYPLTVIRLIVIF